MDTLTIALIPAVFFIGWIYMSFIFKYFPTLTGKRILLLIAHPDDEAMFFGPTIHSLILPEHGNQVKILCLSNGNADGLGQVRQKELQKSAEILGLQSTDVIIVDDPNLQDGPEPWNPQHISRTLLSSIVPSLSKTPTSKPLTSLVDTIITFDEDGVSQHPNHVACYNGAQAFLSDLMRGREGWESPVGVYALKSVGILRKYIHSCDGITTLALCVVRILKHRWYKSQSKSRPKDGRGGDRSVVGGASPETLVFVNTPWAWNKAQRAMIYGHWSQMVWFRWGWIGLGRYLLINDLVKVKPV